MIYILKNRLLYFTNFGLYKKIPDCLIWILNLILVKKDNFNVQF